MSSRLLTALTLCCAPFAHAATETIPLAGEWEFAADSAPEEGRAAGPLPGRIRLPGTTDEAGVGGLQADTGKNLGVLVRKHDFLGVAWYSREIVIPPAETDSTWTLTLERVIWQSRVFVDGKEAGPAEDSLCTPHVHRLGRLAPGRHRLTLRVDNRMIHPIGNKNHAYGEQTQSRWNGVVGRIELRREADVEIGAARVFADAEGRVRVESDLRGNIEGAKLRVRITDPESGATLGEASADAASGAGSLPVAISGPVVRWSEFTPKLYEARIDLTRGDTVADRVIRRFGFRTVSREGNRLRLNGTPLFLRGNLDCVHFPKTGYPATTKAEWLAIFRRYLEHNFNHVRFHSWCPPEAAFEAADELGLIVQAEGPIWIDGWMTHPNERPEMDTEGYPQGLGKGDRTIDAFARAEFRRILDTYGDHPSFCLFAFGNELGPSDFAVTGRWVGELKRHDPRRLYAASTARAITPECDFNATHSIPGIGACRQHYEAGTDWDYEKAYSRAPVPILAHEVGQWPVYPEWSLCEKFTGTLRNTRLEKLREQARANGVLADQPEFTRASGAISRILYKDEIESFLRTADCRGFQLLSMQDFQGQGEAYVGWLDCFWDSKGVTSAADFRGHCAPIVALARFRSPVLTDGETLAADLLVRNDGPADIADRTLAAVLTDEAGHPLARRELRVSGARGGLIRAGRVEFTVSAPHPTRLHLRLELEGKSEANAYPFWVFPKKENLPPAPVVTTFGEFSPEAEAALAEGKSVLLLAHRLGDARTKKSAAWMPLYWSVPFFPGQNIETLGLVVRNSHPALREFPTEDFGDRQWRSLCAGARGFDLTGLVPESFKPIAQPVPDFHLNRKLASLFECRVGPGRLLVCGYDLEADTPEARQLRLSLARHVASRDFAPTHDIPAEVLRKILVSPAQRETVPPPEFAGAAFYHVAGGKIATDGASAFSTDADRTLAAHDGYRLLNPGAEGLWRDETVSAWHGKRLSFDLAVPSGVAGALWVRFSDHNHAGRTGELRLQGRALTLGKHDSGSGEWVKIDVMREDSLNGPLRFSASCVTGPNLMITHIAFIPKE